MVHSQNWAETACGNCGKQLSIRTKYFQVFGETAICGDCAAHTQCVSCEKPLRIALEKFRAMGGDPIQCAECAKQASQADSQIQSTTAEKPSFWSGLSIGEKIIFIPLLIGFLGATGLAVLMGSAGVSPEYPVKAAAPLFLLLYWTYSRGKKNSVK
jgi:hypothetical protein